MCGVINTCTVGHECCGDAPVPVSMVGSDGLGQNVIHRSMEAFGLAVCLGVVRGSTDAMDVHFT